MIKLIGMLDSPFVRAVAIAMQRFQIPYEHLNWSVGKDFDRIREYNPLGRVPTLVLDDGETLIESSAMLDYLDEQVGPGRALLPRSGRDRLAALRIIAMATGAAEKGRDQMYERAFKPPEKWHEPWLERCRMQMHGALAELERIAATKSVAPWLVGERFTRADLMVTCIFTLLSEALAATFKPGDYPKLRTHVARCEEFPEFKSTYTPWSAPSH
jgi:glutathione S-transferase